MKNFEFLIKKSLYAFFIFSIAYFSIYFSFSSEGTSDGGVHRAIYSIIILACFSLFVVQPRLLNDSIYSFSIVSVMGLIIAIYNYIITNHSEDFFLNIVIGILTATFLVAFTYNNKTIAIKTFKFFILLNVIALMYQYINNVILGSSEYLHGELFSFSRQYYSLYEHGFDRVSGYQMEPGSYSTLMVLTVLNLYFLEKKATNWTYLGLISCILTLSAISIFLCAITLTIINRKFLSSSSGKFKFIILLLLSFLVFDAIGFTEYLNERFASNAMDYSALYKISNINAIFSRDLFELFTGMGLSWIEPYCYNCGHLTGNGGGMYTISGVGIIGVFLYISIYLICKDKILAVLIISLLFISRFSVEYSLFWFFILNAIQSTYTTEETKI